MVGKIDPGQRRSHMMVQMPVVVEPDLVEDRQCFRVSRALAYVPYGAEVMGVLHRRPHAAKATQQRGVAPDRDLPCHADGSVAEKSPNGLDLHQPRVFWV